MTPDYSAIARRVAAMTATDEDIATVVQLLRDDPDAAPIPEGAAPPVLDSADSFESYVLDRYQPEIARLEDTGTNPSNRYAGLYHTHYGNEYGESERLGAAMWAAFVRLLGKVDDGDDDKQG